MQATGLPSEEFPIKPSPFKPFTIPEPEPALPLTTIVAGKCPDGVAIACDSQGTSEADGTKNLNVNKIVPITDGSGQPAMVLAGSGDSDHINLLAESITRSAKQRKFKDSEIRGEMKTVLLRLYREHNVDHSRELGLDGVVQFYKPQAILGVRLKEPGPDGQAFGLYYLRPDGFVIPVPKYRSLGSGGHFADFLMGMTERQFPLMDLKWEDINLKALQLTLAMIVNQIKFGDLYSGGPTKLAIINASGAREITETELLTMQQEAITIAESKKGSLESIVLKLFKGYMLT